MRTLLEGDPQGLVQNELTERMASDPNTIASLVNRMERAGLIERRTHEKDRRANRIRLKPVGKRKYEAARQVALGLQTEILSALPEESREQFLEHLALVADACQSALDEVPKRQS